jgi:1-deoxy-D-xylulose-5-phosphate synthase
MVYPCLEAAHKLEKSGISLAVMNARFASPLDEKMILDFAEKGGVIITAEEGISVGGFGSAVREFLDSHHLFDVRFKRIAIPKVICPVGKVEQIRRMFRLDLEGIIDQIKILYEAENEETNRKFR